MADTAPISLDLRHLRCPMPVLRTRKALKAAPSGQVLEVRCTDPLAAIDIPHLLQQTGDILLGLERGDTDLVFTIRKA